MTGEAVDDVHALARVDVVDRALAVDHERRLLHLDVHRAPPNILLGARLGDDPLILGRAARLRAGAHAQRARVRQERPLLTLARGLDQHGRRRVVDDLRPTFLDVLGGGSD